MKALVSWSGFILLLLAPALSQSVSTALDRKTYSAWEEVVFNAAEAALQAVIKQTGHELSLRDVPLDTLQIFTGRQHHVGVSIDGIKYEVVLGNERDLKSQAQAAVEALPGGEAASQFAADDGSGVGSEDPGHHWPQLVAQHWQQQAGSGQHSLALPETVLSGPLELVVSGGAPVSLFIPNAADVGPVRRVRLAAGATVRVSGHKAISLRQPLELPSLPLGYLAEAWAHAKLGAPEAGFDKSPGVLFMANQLREMALNTSLPLLSLELQAASKQGITITSAHATVPHVPTRLKVKRNVRDGSVELSPRQGQVATLAEAVSLELAELSHLWAWPLPHVDMAAYVPYETLLRSILAAHPFNVDKVARKGISMKLTKSEIRGVRLMAFEMEVRSHVPATLSEEARGGSVGEGLAQEESQLHVFDVLVQVKENEGEAGVDSHSPFHYVPISVKLKRTYGNTLTLSKASLAMLTGATNDSLPQPLGYESEDLGLASNKQ